MSKSLVTLQLTAAIAIAGNIVPAGQVVEVEDDLARNLLHRNKAVLHGESARLDVSNAPGRMAAEGDDLTATNDPAGPHAHEGGTVTTDQDARARALKDSSLTAAKFEKLPAAERESLLAAARAAIVSETQPAA